jgi:hypothetical protein
VYASEADARAAAERAEAGLRQARLADMTASGSMVTLSSLATFDEEGGGDAQQRMNLIIKGDTSGVVEAIRGALSALPQDVVVLRYLLAAAGDVTLSDVDLAAASGGMVVGFNLTPDEAVLAHAKRLGAFLCVLFGRGLGGFCLFAAHFFWPALLFVDVPQNPLSQQVQHKFDHNQTPKHTTPHNPPQPQPQPQTGVTINTYRVIYNLIDDVKAAMEGRLRQVEERVPMGAAKVKAVFGTGKKRVAGCEVTEGKLVKGCQVEVRRGKEVVYKGALASLRRVKDAVDEVPAGLECGLGVDGFTAWQEGDVIDCYMVRGGGGGGAAVFHCEGGCFGGKGRRKPTVCAFFGFCSLLLSTHANNSTPPPTLPSPPPPPPPPPRRSSPRASAWRRPRRRRSTCPTWWCD